MRIPLFCKHTHPCGKNGCKICISYKRFFAISFSKTDCWGNNVYGIWLHLYLGVNRSYGKWFYLKHPKKYDKQTRRS